MITCPKCQIEFRGVDCPKCAWKPKSQRLTVPQICEHLNEEATATEKAKEWLQTQGIKTEDMTRQEKIQTLREMASNMAAQMRDPRNIVRSYGK